MVVRWCMASQESLTCHQWHSTTLLAQHGTIGTAQHTVVMSHSLHSPPCTLHTAHSPHPSHPCMHHMHPPLSASTFPPCSGTRPTLALSDRLLAPGNASSTRLDSARVSTPRGPWAGTGVANSRQRMRPVLAKWLRVWCGVWGGVRVCVYMCVCARVFVCVYEGEVWGSMFDEDRMEVCDQIV